MVDEMDCMDGMDSVDIAFFLFSSFIIPHSSFSSPPFTSPPRLLLYLLSFSQRKSYARRPLMPCLPSK